MYLKSLVLKGFKSFADRSVLNLEPGVTAVVGPNGSGKSNISDAVLWVLGERNAKNLRGQVMEDVIFAGSSKRRSVNVAEVTLVLDNSDGALPVDYDEVSIMRRMYRNGESEYLINGTLARRMDILDILHDSGLGTGTHSIISQGHLDSILQSKPEDRRALIEEAAGVLKHKQRKAKSQRKLEQMDTHLARVNDVVAEVKRQLGPLERKAKRALAYKDVSAELADLTLKLAVDDLRNLQTDYEACNQSERALREQLEERRAQIAQVEQQAEQLQERIAQDSNDVMVIVRRSQRLSACTQRLDSQRMLLVQHARSARGRAGEYDAQQARLSERISAQQAELAETEQQLEALRAEHGQAISEHEAAAHAHDAQLRLTQELAQRVSAAEAKRTSLAAELEQLNKQLVQQQESLAAGSGRISTLQARIDDLNAEREQLAAQLDERHAHRSDIAEQVERASVLVQKAADRLSQAKSDNDQARDSYAAAREREQLLNAELLGIEELERTLAAASGSAYGWIASQESESFGAPVPLSHLIHAPQALEALIERLLSDDVTALLVDDAERVRALGAALQQQAESGLVTLLMREDGAKTRICADAAAHHGGQALIAQIQVEPQAQRIVQALLGDVVVCESAEEALRLHHLSDEPLRFATIDGFVVFPTGKVLLGTPVKNQEEGALERGRRYAEVKKLLAEARTATAHANELLQASDERLAKAQTDSLTAGQSAAQAQGNLLAADEDVRASKAKISAVDGELEQLRTDLAAARSAHESSEPHVRELSRTAQETESGLQKAKEEFFRVQAALEPARAEEQKLAAALAEARLAAATLAERMRHVEHSRDTLRVQCSESTRSLTGSHAAAMRHELSALRSEPIAESLSEVARCARARLAVLESAVSQAQESSAALSERQAQARSLTRQAHEAFEETNAKLSDVRVEKGRLELRVQSAIDQIVHECATSMEAALDLPPLENREEVELTATRLRNRIAKMGTINPDAAAEYEQLKERYDYLAAQLADLHAARMSLAKIDRVIEARMKDDFANTFVQVNEIFKQIFAILFPGGQAYLSLVDPDNMDTTGVEVAAQPSGKRVMKMSLMSGGEKSLVALALLFAAYKIRSAPFYILDEVEAALDDTNLRRLIAYLDEERSTTQLIMITHQRRTMEMADVLFGVSMQSDGISKVISQRLDQSLRYAE